MADNAFVRIDNRKRAQELADALSPDLLHRILDGYAMQLPGVGCVRTHLPLGA